MKKAQALIEYGLLLGITTAAILGMQTYIKRGIQAQIKISADELGKQEESEDFDLKKGLLLVSGQRRKTVPLQAGLPTQRKQGFAGGRQRTEFKEKTEVVDFDVSPLPADAADREFFATDKRSGNLFSQNESEEFSE